SLSYVDIIKEWTNVFAIILSPGKYPLEIMCFLEANLEQLYCVMPLSGLFLAFWEMKPLPEPIHFRTIYWHLPFIHVQETIKVGKFQKFYLVAIFLKLKNGEKRKPTSTPKKGVLIY